MTNEKKQEFTLKISNANPTELIVILYDILLTHLDDARKALWEKDEVMFSFSISSAKKCLDELINSLDMRIDISKNLRRIYFFCLRRIAKCEYTKKFDGLFEVTRLITRLRDSFDEIKSKDNRNKVMRNADEVYLGLTYNRGRLVEMRQCQKKAGV